ncbi:hypothetical protein SARC_11766 [Sphaeroforma arctica JP610]|uniref:Uncharacterized protein n=1 Tax=Sphaeroforma arctica JP610 TaxID=667725 RepID=A0A0L0FG31_9EUKA|nr:hypothetical protein SARC_11766 [Sphaeroforma arctica JP610]KNC75710.1 hypothetical protein SARC_11766 [Sphaeroforma arctica JP610]|eukprot:XP_014149612.1 hypothetical protein SARC_11766 [Sphaeroforma arctica JP610]
MARSNLQKTQQKRIANAEGHATNPPPLDIGDNVVWKRRDNVSDKMATEWVDEDMYVTRGPYDAQGTTTIFVIQVVTTSVCIETSLILK